MDIESIALVRTKNGELFMGQLDLNDGKAELRDSYMINMVPTSNNSFNIMLMPVFMPLLKDAVDLELTGAIMAVTKPNKDLQTQYIAAVTNIVMSTQDVTAQPLIKG